MLSVELLQLKDKNPLVLSVAPGDFFRSIRKKRAIHKKMGAGSKKKGKITCLVFIFFLSLQQNKVFKKTIEPTIQGGLIQVNL